MKLRIIFVITLLLFASAFDCSKKAERGEFRGSFSTKENIQTPKGASVGGYTMPEGVILQRADEGLTELFRLSRQYDYTYGLYYGFWQVWLFETSTKCIAPGFTVRADGSPWDNLPPPNDFDKDPRPGKVLLCVAGMTVGDSAMLVANHESHMANIVRFEGEHLVLLHNDRPKYEATAGVHAHPLITEREAEIAGGAAGFTFVGGSSLSPSLQRAATATGHNPACIALVK